MTANLTRRTFLGSLVAAGGVVATGCGAEQRNATTPAVGPVQAAAMTVYRDPSCGCCKAWAAIARNAGHQVQLVDHPDMPAIKRQYGVPEQLLSCHTTIVGGYAVEGHVPLEDVQRLLAEKPAGVRGIAVAGMPLGSPGMEVPDGTTQPFEVVAFTTDGKTSVFTS